MKHSLLVLLIIASACGDDGAAPHDAGPMDTHLGTACDDGIDNDGDGKTDYPQDPGCVAPNADDETDDCPNGTNCPQCGNGRDDDGNGAMDYPGDPGCESAGDGLEVTVSPVACGATMMIKDLPVNGADSGTLGGVGVQSTSQIASPCGGGGGAQAIAYRLILSQPAVIVASTSGSQLDTVLDLRSSMCSDPGAEVTCHDDVDIDDKTSRITRSLAAGVYYIIVEGADTAATGMYQLTVEKFAGEGVSCSDTSQCGPSLVCRAPFGTTAMICTQPQCGDTLDDDQDGKNGYPTDPGCLSPADNDETDPSPLPACSDGVDNDNDNMTDYPADTSCMSASGASEACSGEMDPIGTITTGTTTGTLVGAHDDHDATCDDDFDGSGVDLLYTITVPGLRSLTVDTNGSDAECAISLLGSTCAEPSITCDAYGGTTGSMFRTTTLAAGTYVVAVDVYSADTFFTPPAPFMLHVSGVIADGQSCEGTLATAGVLTCGNGRACLGTAGSRTCETTQCSDGISNTDGDSLIDYPFDPGCTSPADNDETDPGTAPVCHNGVDDDGGGGIDWPADYGCSSAAGASEVFCSTETNPTSLITASPTTGTTMGATDNYPALSCAYMGDSTGPDIALALSLPVSVDTLTLDLSDSDFDTELSFRDTSCVTEIACDEDGGEILASLLELTDVSAGNYAIIIDGYSGDSGMYSLDIHGVVAPGTSCVSPLFTTGVLACPSPQTCAGNPKRCQ